MLRLVSLNAVSHWEKSGLLGEMNNLMSQLGNVQDEPGIFIIPESKKRKERKKPEKTKTRAVSKGFWRQFKEVPVCQVWGNLNTMSNALTCDF